MKHIIIRNLGPLTEAHVTLSSINIVLGPQSSGKSCLLKTACYCTWVEKCIQLSQNPDMFGVNEVFEKKFIEFHKLEGYTSDKTYIEFENDSMHFSYSWESKKFVFSWKEEKRWDYICPKISYIPAERNMVSAITNWFEVSLNNDNIRNFMKDWQDARNSINEGLPILNLGVTYKYDKYHNKDKVVLNGGNVLELTNTSSGLQSLIPLLVHLNHLYKKRFETETPKNILRVDEELFLRGIIFERMQKFHANDNRDKAQIIFENFTARKRTEIFLEEPEQNLFPPTQMLLANKLMKWAKEEHGGLLFIATHSPYMVTSFLETNDRDIAIFVTKENEDGRYIIYTASEENLQELYDYSIDVFHNLNNIG